MEVPVLAAEVEDTAAEEDPVAGEADLAAGEDPVAGEADTEAEEDPVVGEEDTVAEEDPVVGDVEESEEAFVTCLRRKKDNQEDRKSVV